MPAPIPRKSVDSTVRGTLNESGALGQLQAHSYYTREPGLKDIPEQGLVLAYLGSVMYIYARKDGNRFRIALTLV